jgi:hypothetical protein
MSNTGRSAVTPACSFECLLLQITMPKADRQQSTQFLPFSSVLHFAKISLSAYRWFMIKADRQDATQL